MKKVCVFTGTRAEYGLLASLMGEIKRSASLELQVFVSGTHLSGAHGMTYTEIENDGFVIDARVELPLDTETSVGVGESIGVGIKEFTKALDQLNPDVVVVLGDRYETMAMAVAAMSLRIPIAHLHGGESTVGAMDEAMRHSITKMSHLHFVATEEYRRRVIQLGEDPGRVFNVGALGLDNIKNLKLLSKQELEDALGLKLNQVTILVTYHPVTLQKNTARQHVRALLKALDERKDANIVFTKANADREGQLINDMIETYVSKNQSRAWMFPSLGRLKYLSLLQYAGVMLGNSSSGIIEAVSFKLPVVNIGRRQEGRLKPANVLDADPTFESIREKLAIALDGKFHGSLKELVNPYGDGRASEQIVSVLESADLNNLLIKEFHDMKAAA